MIEGFRYTDKEMDELIKSMVFLIDTREKQNQHIVDYFDRKGITHKSKALSYADYSFMLPANADLGIMRDTYFDKRVVIERKGSLEELSGNLTKERDRFEKELTLAPKTKLILVENAGYGDLVSGNYQTQYNKKSFWASIHSFWHKYECPVVFMPDSKFSGVFIRGYFEYYLKNFLK